MADAVRAPKSSVSTSSVWQLLKYALLAFLLMFVLLMCLHFVTLRLDIGSESNTAVDFANNSITLNLGSEPPQLDSTRSTDMVSGQVLGHVMEGLIRYGPNNEILPGIAKSWDVSDLSSTFYLRDDAFWSNGTPVTAHDFVFAWQTALDPDTASQYSFILYPLKNGEKINAGDLAVEELGATALDDYTLQVELEQPTPYFIKLLAFFTYLPINREFYESRDGKYGTNAEDLIYNGPFDISKWQHGSRLRLEKSHTYWNKNETLLDAIEFGYIISDPNAILNLFATEKIVLAGLQAENIERALSNRWPIKEHVDGSVFYLGFNHRADRPTSNRNLRKAIQLVCDPEELVYKILKTPGNRPGESIFPVWLKGVDGYFRDEYPAPKHEPNVKVAQEHLADALNELGLTTPPKLIFLTGDSEFSSKHAEYYQSLFKDNLGIEVRIDQQIFQQRLAKMTSGEYDIVAAGWGPDYDDVLTFGDLFTSWNANNRGLFKNDVLDRNVQIAQQSSDARTRMEAMDRVQHILYEEAAIIFEYERGSNYVSDDRVQGITRRAVGTDPDFTRAYLVNPQTD